MSKVRKVIDQDLYRYMGTNSTKAFWKCYMTVPGFKYMYWFRKASHWRIKAQKSILAKPIFAFFELTMRHYGYKYGIDIPSDTRIGAGFYIGHFSGIVVSGGAKIGCNVNISQSVTIGSVTEHCPVIGDGVYIGPGAVITGGVFVGQDAAIGANAVVTHDIEQAITVAGAPAKKINEKGAKNIIKNKV